MHDRQCFDKKGSFGVITCNYTWVALVKKGGEAKTSDSN